ncbi:unnamed protein product [Urochloa humidicola]
MAVRILLLLLFTLAAAAITTTLLPLATNPCTHLLSRAILAATGLDPYLLSCSIATSNAPPLFHQAGTSATSNTTRAHRPIVTDQRCAMQNLLPFALPPFHCCPPPSSSAPIPFTFPDPTSPLRTRRPAHTAGNHMAKYARAVALMKALPVSDPRSFYQQANVHCAYCTGAHRQADGQPDDLGVEVHFSWLFFPFHRAYLYFFERIAAKLLADPTFALPFWSWDVPDGMSIPPAFASDDTSPLHDANRRRDHALADLDFAWGHEKNITDDDQVTLNLRLMYKQMVGASAGGGAVPPSLFLGQPYRAGDAARPGAGTLEWAPHNTMHVWTGDQSLYNVEDMGVYYSAGRDPIFYAHHANIDRLWELWRRRITAGGDRADLDDPDWLHSSFLLYDEEARLVRVAVRDMLHAEKLRCTYDDGGERPPWLDARPPVTPGVNLKGGRRVESAVRFPVSLEKAVTAEVRRPPEAEARRRWRSMLVEEEKKLPLAAEVLVVEGIEAEAEEFVRFDVYVNAREFEKVPPGGREMIGSFTTLKRPGGGGKVVRTSMRLALSELLEDLGAGGDDSVTVTLVPVSGNVTIGGLAIVFMEE